MSLEERLQYDGPCNSIRLLDIISYTLHHSHLPSPCGVYATNSSISGCSKRPRRKRLLVNYIVRFGRVNLLSCVPGDTWRGVNVGDS
jgi:hypothetical protein